MASVFSLGQRFNSFTELDAAIKLYQTQSFCVLVTRDSRSVEATQKRLANKKLNPALKYNDVKYACHHGGDYKNRGSKGVRQTYTSKIGCPFRLQFRTTEDGQQLELKSWVTEHNHELTELLEEKNKKNIPADILVDDLQSRYSEYKRKKKFAFRTSVQRAYDVIKEEQGDDYDKYEEAFLKKQKGNSSSFREVSPDFSDDNEGYISYNDTNAMNSFMSSMYKKNKKRAAHSAPVSASSSPKRPDLDSAGIQVPDMGKNLFVIDKTGTKNKKKPAEKYPGFSSSTPKSKDLVPDQSIELPVVMENGEINSALEKPVTGSDPEITRTDKDGESVSMKDNASVKSASGTKRKKRTQDRESSKKLPEAQLSTVTFADVGGSDKTLKEVCKLLVHMRHPEVYQQLGITPPRGFLLHGPPGCGKTLLANAIAGELSLPFIKLAATEVVSGVSGESEEKLRDIFEKAISSAPCILFIDEIDSITQKRENASKDMERRIVAQLLACMDDLNSKPSIQVLVIGATNRADSIDPALRRAGRFDREISLGIPGEEARQRILEVLCRGLRLSPNFDFKSLAHHSPGFVGADLMSLTREAAMVAVNRVFEGLQTEAPAKTNVFNSVNENADICTDNPSEIQPSSQALTELTITTSNTECVHTEDLTSKSEMEVDDPIAEDSIVCSVTETEGVTSLGKESQEENLIQPEILELESTTEISQVMQTEIVQEETPTRTVKTKDDYNLVLSWLKDHPPLSQDQLASLFITMDDFQTALKLVQPSAKREGFATIPDVTWEDIGALKDIRVELELAIMAPVRHPEQFRALGLTSPPGILLAGPPGCGKTLLAKAVANESGINFISVKGPELLNMYVGESERAVRQVFQRARNSAPCVIFFDEIDALCPRRSGSGEGGSSVRVVNQLLTEMDGLEERKQVFIMGATNRPDIIDPAILRPGRLDKQLYVGLPGPGDRLDILRTITKNGTKPRVSEDVIFEDISNDGKCDCFTGADLAALVREASVTALREVISQAPHTNVRVSKRHFDEAFTKVKHSVSQKDLEIYKKMKSNLATS